MITHNHAGMRSAWKSYLDNLSVEKEFHHKDQFQKKYPNHGKTLLPAVFIQKSDLKLKKIVSAETLNEGDLGTLMKNINTSLKLVKEEV
jgi:hypothetical protein